MGYRHNIEGKGLRRPASFLLRRPHLVWLIIKELEYLCAYCRGDGWGLSRTGVTRGMLSSLAFWNARARGGSRPKAMGGPRSLALARVRRGTGLSGTSKPVPFPFLFGRLNGYGSRRLRVETAGVVRLRFFPAASRIPKWTSLENIGVREGHEFTRAAVG